ncbi:MAG TPA: peptidylprolyl isomerase [Verrucomicrobiota bacterium]|jgi:cyclophilin family peptidyl-prolyl cis-trans isomerase|nr:peptidylprolyl isomerase [Verrucomicrobiota bacterium]
MWIRKATTLNRMTRMRSFSCILAVLWTSLAAGRAADSLAQVHTPLGDWLLVLFDTDKPVTVANFKQYVATGRFRDSFVHRWEPGFVIQGGGFFVTNRFKSNPSIASMRTFGSITNEYSVGPTLSNTYGTIAMARVGGQTNSATSQWFLNLADNVGLDTVDGGFTVFGRVAVGTNLLNRFNRTSVANGIFPLNLGGPLYQVPVLSPAATFGDLIYSDFSLPEWPRVRIAVDAGRLRLEWNSLSNFVHHLEFASGFPLSWQTLVSTNGTGQTIEVFDDRPGAASGCYRVRIE